MTDITIKQGSQLDHRIGLKLDGALVTYGDLVNPKALMRRRTQARADAVEITITSDTSDPTKWNARLSTSPGQTDVPGEYVIEVDATQAGVSVTFPSGGHLTLRVLGDVGL